MFNPSSLTQFEEIILLLLIPKIISDVISSFFLDRNNTWNFLGFTNMSFCFNQFIAIGRKENRQIINNKRHQFTFHVIFKNFRKTIQYTNRPEIIYIALSNGLTTARFAMFGKVHVFKLQLIIRVKDLYIQLAEHLTSLGGNSYSLIDFFTLIVLKCLLLQLL